MSNLPIRSERRMPVQEQHTRVVMTKHGRRRVRVNSGFNKEVTRRPIEHTEQPKFPFPETKTKESKVEPIIKLPPRERPAAPRSKDLDDWATSMVATLRFPTIAYTGQEGSYPQPLKEKIPLVRMIQLMKNPQDFKENATDEEVLGYLSTASLSGPFDRDAYELMAWLFARTQTNIPKDLEVPKELGYGAKHLYDKLRKDIRKSQWTEFKNRMKTEESKNEEKSMGH